jgi:hypothetical protein
MDIKQALALSLVSTLTLSTPALTHARNCIKGKPCGKGCISLDKTCHIGANPSSHDNILRYDPAAEPDAIIRRTIHRLPKVAVVTAESVNAKQSPDSNTIIKKYKQGQRVFVYETQDAWARVSNMQPDEWVKLEALRLK